MNRTHLVSIGILLVVIGVWQFYPRGSASLSTGESITTGNETSSTTTPTTGVTVSSTTTASQTPKNNSTTHPLPIATGDRILSWEFRGAYTGNPELVIKAQHEIQRLSGLLATATSSALILSVGIANQYELLGDGEKQYEYLEGAIRADGTSSLPWHNLGVLMEKLGAYRTARIAYEKSTRMQPEFKFYHYAYIEFLLLRMKQNTPDIEKAFAWATKNIGETNSLRELRTEWGR